MQANSNRTSPLSATHVPGLRSRASRISDWLRDRSDAPRARWSPPLIAAAERAVNGAHASRFEAGHAPRLRVHCELERCA